MSVAIYDTAWLAMISREIDGVTSWTFPECFQYVLDNQLPDGGWESYASPIISSYVGVRSLITKCMRPSSPLEPF